MTWRGLGDPIQAELALAGQQRLDRGDHTRGASNLATHVLLRLGWLGRPRVDDVAGADADAQCRLRGYVRSSPADGLSDEAIGCLELSIDILAGIQG